MLERLTGRRLEEFRSRFFDYHNASQRLMREWTEARLKDRLYDRLEQEIGLLLREVEEMFLGVERLREELGQELESLGAMHLPQAGYNGNLFVYADPASKEDVWQRLQESPGSKRQGPRPMPPWRAPSTSAIASAVSSAGRARAAHDDSVELFRRTAGRTSSRSP
jgi:hypothetical protein